MIRGRCIDVRRRMRLRVILRMRCGLIRRSLNLLILLTSWRVLGL